VSTQLQVIEAAIARTRNNARNQLALGLVVSASFLIWRGSPIFTAVLISLNVLISFMFARRLWRLRRGGPAVQALIERPAEVATIQPWPPKLPPNRMPVMIDVFARTGEQCTLLLDPKQQGSTHALVEALKARSPDATMTVPSLPQAKIQLS